MVLWPGSPNFWPRMVVANAVPYGQYFHQVACDLDPSDIVDLLTASPLCEQIKLHIHRK